MATQPQPANDPLAQALESALVENPDDLAAHCAYADYLTDKGDPRGEFIQVQIALENPLLSAEERGRLQQREAALFRRHRLAWLGSVSPLCPDYLVSAVNVPGTVFHFARGWIGGATVFRLTPYEARVIATAPELRLLRSLAIFDGEGGSRNPALESFTLAHTFRNVRAFGLGDAKGDYQFRRYPSPTHLGSVLANMPGLRELNLNVRGLDAAMLFGSPDSTSATFSARPINWAPLSGLHTLRLYGIDLGNPGVRELAGRDWWPNLRVLQVRRGRFGNIGAGFLARSRLMSHLDLLDVSGNYLTVAGLQELKPFGSKVIADDQIRPEDDVVDTFDPDDDSDLDIALEGIDSDFELDLGDWP